MKLKHFILALVAMLSGFAFTANAQNVAKVGNTEYATIDEAVAAWTNGTTLTLLDNVTLSDVVTLKSTEHRILDLGTYTMYSASNKNAFVIKACGTGDAERTAITINADATNPGGINAGSKCVVYYKYADGGISGTDRPIIKIEGGVFTGSTSTWGTAGIYTIGTEARKCATLNISGGTFNCSINGSGKSKLIISGGVFNYSVGSQGDKTAYRLISGGKFKTLGFMTADSNNTKFWFGTSMANSNVGLYVDDEGYLCVGGPVITELSPKYKAVASNATKWSSYLAYSSAATNGLYYTDADAAIKKHGEANVTVYEHAEVVEELDNNAAVKDFTPALPSEVVTFEVEAIDIEATAEATTKVTFNVEPKNASGAKVSNPSAEITFRLPVPAAWTGKANVYHEGTLLGAYTIKEESGAKYVEVSSANFSEFSVEAIVPTEVEVATLAELQAALADNSNELPIVITAQIEIPADETVELDLNGKTVTVVYQEGSTTKHIYALDNYGTLTITDSKGNGSINSRGIFVQDGSKLTVESGSLYGIDSNGGSALYQYGGDIVINGGHIEQKAEGTYNFAINALGGTVTVNGGKIAGNHGAIAAGGATVVINDGELVCTGTAGMTDNVLYTYGTGEITINGGTFVADKDGSAGGCCVYDANGKATINGGTFGNSSGGDVWGTTGTTIKGGTFENLTEKQHIAAGYELNADGTVAAKPVAQIGEQKYMTLGEAVAALKDGETLTITSDITSNNDFIELNGKTNITLTAAEGVVINGNIQVGYHASHTDNNVDRSASTFTVDGLTVNGTLTVLSNDANLVVKNSKAAQITVKTYREGMNIAINDNTADGSIGTAANSYGMFLVPNATGYDLTVDGNTFKDVNSHAFVVQGCGDGSAVTAANSIVVTNNNFESWGTGGKTNRAAFKIWADTKYAPAESDLNGTTNAMRELVIAIAAGNNTYSSTANNTVQFDAYGAAGNADDFPAPKYAVAKIGDVEYADLQEAINETAAANGGTVTLISDVTYTTVYTDNKTHWNGDLNYELSVGGNVTLDLNGHTIKTTGGSSHSYYALICVRSGSLTVVDNSTEKTGAIICSAETIKEKAYTIYNNGALTLNGGTVSNTVGNYAIESVTVSNTALNINEGATVTSTGIAVRVCSQGSTGTQTVAINGGNLSGTYAMWVPVKNGGSDVINMTIAGGTFTGSSNAILFNTYTNGDFTTDNIAITGGTFNGNVLIGADYAADDANHIALSAALEGKVISGGTFSNDVSRYVAEGYAIKDNGNGTFGIEEAAAVVAKIGETGYATLAEAVAAVKEGETITMLEDATISEKLTLPAGITFDGNGYQISGAEVWAAGDLTFAGHTKVTSFNAGYEKPVITIGEGACLEMNGTGRMVIGHGATFNITGTITDAKTANVADLTPSLIMPGASFTGAGVTFNVTNAYIKTTASYCSSSKSASGTFDFNINNSIWEQFNKLAFEAQSTAATVNFDLVNSVLNTGSHLVFGVSRGEVVIDNSNVNVGKSNQIENQSTMIVKNGAVVNGSVATSSNAKNPGTIIVENATYAVTGEFSGSDLGTGTLIIKKGANVSAGSITKANIQVDATGMVAGDAINLTANLSKLAGTLEVINNDKLEAKIVDGKVVLAAKPVAKIGETGYATLAEAVTAAQAGNVIVLQSDVVLDNTVTIAKSITIDGNGHKVTPANAETTYNSAFMVGDSGWGDDHGETITINNVVFEGWSTKYGVVRAQGVTLAMDGCEFNGSSVSNAAYAVLSLNYTDATVENTTFANNKDRAIDVNYNADGSEAVVTIDACTFDGNTTTGAGIIYKNAGDVKVKNSTFVNNTVSTNGNAATVYTGWGDGDEVTNCTFKNNTVTTSHASTKRFASAIFCDGCVVSENVFGEGNTATRNGGSISTIVAVAAYYGAADISANYWGAAPENDNQYTIEYTRNEVALNSYYRELDAEGNPTDLYTYPVAKIGDVEYTSLQAAIDAVKEGETITLVDDVNVTTPAYGQNALNHAKAVSFTLDLNGKTLSADTGNSVFRFNIAGSGATSDVTLTIKNGTIVAGSNTWCAVMASGISADVKAIMNLEDLTIEASKAGDLAVKSWSNATINAKNVTVNATNAAGGFYAVGGEIVLDNCTVNQKGLHTAPYLSMAFAVSTNGKMTVNSGTYSAEPTTAAEGSNQGSTHGSWVGGVMNSGGELIINGGTFSNGNFGDDALATDARGLIFADTNGEVTVNGGTFNALKSIFDFQNNLGGTSPVITVMGGNYSADPRTVTSYGSIVLDANCVVVENDGVWNVVKAAAKIGDKAYASLEEAFKAAATTEGCTIEILSDVTVDYYWDARNTGAKFTVPVTINGNDHTIKFTNTVYDGGNHMSVFRFEADATVNNLTIDMSEAQSGFAGRFRAISAKGNLTVNGCTFIGNGSENNTRAIIFGEGASTTDNTISVTNSTFTGWRRGISDNESGKDAAANVIVTGNTLTDAAVYVSATTAVTFKNNTVNANVDIRSYTADNSLNVTATDNTLTVTEGVEYKIKAGGTINAQNEFVVPAKGSVTPAFAGATSIWGEGGGNAKQSLVVKLYSGETLLATASLNNIGGILNGNVYVTWNIPLNAASNDEYWTVEWSNPVTAETMPTKVVMVIDGVEVAENNFQLNGPDNLNMVYAAVADADGKFTQFSTTLAAAVNAAQAGQTVVLLKDVEVASSSTITLDGVNVATLEGVTLTNNGAFQVKGEVSLNIATLAGSSIDFLDGAIIKNSTIGGNVFVAGNVTFRGANTFAMLYDYGTLTDYYGTTAPMKWTVEEGASVTLTDKSRYGLGYGDNVTVKGNIEDALTARENLTEDALSLFMHGLVAQESKGWDCSSALNVENAYVAIGSNNSFGNKPGNYGGTYTFNITNSVVDASRITFYEALSATTFTIDGSDVKMGTFMTRDADSEFTLKNSKVLSTTTTNGNDEGNYNKGVLTLENSSLTYSAEFKHEAGVINLDINSLLTAPKLSGTGAINVDATGVTTPVAVIKADMIGFNGTITVEGGDYEITETGLVIKEKTLAGAGTEENPYLISNVAELVFFRDKVNSGDTKYNAPGVWVALAADIDLAGTTWTEGIGDGHNWSFDGNFDGQGHTIKNLTIAPYADANKYLCGGLFGYIYGNVTIKDLTIENATVEFAGEEGKEYFNVGVLVGFANNNGGKANISGITVKGDIKVDAPNAYGVGAIVGYSYREMGTIANCKVEANAGSYIKGHSFVGGITGYSYTGAAIADCSVKNIAITATKYSVGGIAGITGANTTVSNCYVDVENVTVNGEANVGNVVGAISADALVVENCTAAEPLVGGNYSDNKPVEARIGNKYYATLTAALVAEGNEVELLVPVTVAKDETRVIDLNGKTVTGVDNATASFALITNKGDLTITGNGKITLTATENRGWNAYSSVISNSCGTLVVENGTIEHRGGTDMAYAIDNLSGSGDAECTINGGTIKSTYRAIRQFLNSTANDNILTVNGGTIEGANKSIWFQDPSTKANKGTLTVTEDATLNGDVYLSVTAGSTEWPVEVAIADAAFAEGKTVVTGNVPANYEVVLYEGVHSVECTVIDKLLIVDDGKLEKFENRSNKTVGKLTYERDMSAYVGKWQPLYVPFEIPVEELTVLGYQVAIFYDVHFELAGDGTIDTSSAPDLHILKITSGTLKANYPYVIKPSSDYPQLSIELTNAKLYSTAKSEMNSVESGSTITRFIFAGTYTKATPAALTGDANIHCYGINKKGNFQKMGSGATLPAFRVYMSIVAKDGSHVILADNVAESIRMRAIGEEAEDGTTIIYDVEMDNEQTVDYIYDLQGRRVLEPQKGNLYIINGKKVIF